MAFPPLSLLPWRYLSNFSPRRASSRFLLVPNSSVHATRFPSSMSECCLSVTAVALDICAFAFPLDRSISDSLDTDLSISRFFASINIGILTVQYSISILASVVSSLRLVFSLAVLSCAPFIPLFFVILISSLSSPGCPYPKLRVFVLQVHLLLWLLRKGSESIHTIHI